MSGEVVDVYIDGMEIDTATIIFLMKDGTLEYIPIQKAAKEDNFKSYGKISGVNDIVEVLSSSTGYKSGGGSIGFVALKQDGSFYDIANMLWEKGVYN